MKIAPIQETPVFLNLQQTIEKTIQLIKKAASEGAQLAVFPETWLPGYPLWVDQAPNAAKWDHPGAKKLHRLLYENSLQINSPEFHQLLQAAKNNKINIIIGINERDGASIYNTILIISSDGETWHRHRKFVPTHGERLLWGQASEMDLGVVESEDVRLGSLICWEHWMPLSRAYLHQQHEHVHGALWPTVNEHHQLASRHYAFEGRCYVAAVGSVMTKQQMLEGIASHGSIDPEIDAMLAPLDDGLLMRGGSALIAPDASYIVEPVWDEPGIIYGEADLAALPEYYQSLDTGGHYSRPELFDFKPRA